MKKVTTGLVVVAFLFNSCKSHLPLPQAPQNQIDFNNIIKNFKTPAEDNTIWCYWYWINDDISKEGVTKDLEAMKKAGIGGALIGNINPAGKTGKVPLFSELWWETMVHAVNEGKRLGMEIGVFNCPGWSQSGGPWVKPAAAMRYLTYSEATVIGGRTIAIQLKAPKNNFQDVYTLAFKTLEVETLAAEERKAMISSSPSIPNIKLAYDGDDDTEFEIDFVKIPEISIEIKFPKAITARHLSLKPGSTPFITDCKLYAMLDGEYKVVKEFEYDRSNYNTNTGSIAKGEFNISLPEIRSDQFKLICTNFKKGRDGDDHVGFAEVHIGQTLMLEKYIEKQLGKMEPTPLPKWNTYVWETQATTDSISFSSDLMIKRDAVIDISSHIDSTGLVSWNAPKGNWTIMRFGMTPNGTKNSPTSPLGQGLEIDKMSSALAKFHFDQFIGELLNRIPEESKSAFKYVVGDSYEKGSQNWTDGYEKKFEAKYGYNPIPFLPVLSGRIVGSVEASERFLWDLRRAVADDVAHEYLGGLSKASHEHNLKVWLETYGHWGFPSEFLMYGGQSDLVAGEFWNEGTLGNIECKAASSAAHIYGKKWTSAESFTSSRKAYLRHPAMLKKRGDWSYTEGINHTVLHLFIHQPDDERQPGMNAWFGTEFNRHNTWFSQAKNYFDYIRRCQHLLQQGKYVADVCYFIGENAPIMTGGRVPEIAKGYSYDYINGEVILNRLSVKDGRFVLPDGMSYSIMVLPPFKSMRPEILEKLEQFVAQGGVILGPKPEQSPSLENYPECDSVIKAISKKLWINADDKGKMVHSYGKGYVLDGMDLSQAFEFLKITGDVTMEDNAAVLWTHRALTGMDIYFITNQSDEDISINPNFRVPHDTKPQRWDAMTGEIRALNDYKLSDNGITVPLKLKKDQSWFVVFSSETKESDNSFVVNFPEPQLLQTLNKPYTVDFLNKEIGPKESITFDTLTDWAQSNNEKIKYYSGTATYKTSFIIKNLPKNSAIYLNLGEVSVMAEAKLNGKSIGGVWMAPYRLNITDAVQVGDNQLEIEVVNLWRNRLIKDKMLPENERYTWTVTEDIKGDEMPHVSGLLRPITIELIKRK